MRREIKKLLNILLLLHISRFILYISDRVLHHLERMKALCMAMHHANLVRMS